jgi:membrane protein
MRSAVTAHIAPKVYSWRNTLFDQHAAAMLSLRSQGEDSGSAAKELALIQVSDSGTDEANGQKTGTAEAVVPATKSKWYLLRKEGTALATYLLDSEVHTFAFSVAANSILSFIPFIVLMYTLALSVFHSQTMVGVVTDMVNYFLPTHTVIPNWLPNSILSAVIKSSRHGVQVFSLIMILVACTGIFLPLEVALNQAWGVTKSRNYIMNQTVALGLALVMVALAVISMFLNAGAQQVFQFVFFHNVENFAFKSVCYLWLALSTGVASIVFFFCIYWLLPNCKVPWRPVLRTSIYTGVVWLVSKLIFVAVLPHMDLESLYGPFYVSVGLLLWAYVSGLILFAGAQFSVSRLGQKQG